MMKKIIALMLAVLMLLALVSCDDKKRDRDTEDTEEETVTDSSTKEKTEDEKTEEKKTEEKTEEKKTEDKKTEEKKTEDKKTDEKKTEEKKTEDKTSSNKKIKEYVKANKNDLLSAMESSFATSSGMTCTSDIEVDGNGFIIYININELSDVDAATKAQLQQIYDGMQSYFDTLLTTMQQELPDLEYYEIVVGDKTGDALATIHAGK